MTKARKRKAPVITLAVLTAICGVLAYDLTQQQIVYGIPMAHLDTQWQNTLDVTDIIDKGPQRNVAYSCFIPQTAFLRRRPLWTMFTLTKSIIAALICTPM